MYCIKACTGLNTVRG